MTAAVDELEAIRQLKARHCRFLDTKDVESWRGVFTTDVVVTLDMAVSTAGADPMNVAAMHRCHTPEIRLTSATGANHYHETYEKREGAWRIKILHLTRTILKMSGGDG